MNPLKFLVLTDHRGHSDQNSLYALVRTLAADARVAAVYVASRGDDRNAAFFGGEVTAPLAVLRVDEYFAFDPSGAQFSIGAEQLTFGEADVVWLRLPPPADAAFFARLTPPAPAAGPLIVNDPQGILETGSKAFLLRFPEFTAPVRRMQSTDDVRAFAALHPIVLKPLRDYGGRGLVRIGQGVAELDDRKYPLNQWLQSVEKEIVAGHYLGMKYLRNVSQGDKRILVVNGRILGASLRLPAAGQWLCNVARGGTSVLAEVAPEEKVMIAAVAPVLLAKGVVIFGADTLVDDDGKRVLSELNTNSIGGFPQAQAQTGRPVLQQTIDGLFDYLSRRL